MKIGPLWRTRPPTYDCFQGRYEEIDGLYMQAVSSLLKILGPNNQEAATMLDDWAILLHTQVLE